MYECKRTGADHVAYDNVLESLNNERLRLLSRDTIAEPLRTESAIDFPGDLLGDRRGGLELVEGTGASQRASASSNDSAANSTLLEGRDLVSR